MSVALPNYTLVRIECGAVQLTLSSDSVAGQPGTRHLSETSQEIVRCEPPKAYFEREVHVGCMPVIAFISGDEVFVATVLDRILAAVQEIPLPRGLLAPATPGAREEKMSKLQRTSSLCSLPAMEGEIEYSHR